VEVDQVDLLVLRLQVDLILVFLQEPHLVAEQQQTLTLKEYLEDQVVVQVLD
jgi:hypothetical protein